MAIIFNHVGICVTDLERSIRFYEAIGFRRWWEFKPGDKLITPIFKMPAPIGLTAMYMVLDSFVLELLHYGDAGTVDNDRVRQWNEPGLTHLSIGVDDFDDIEARVVEAGGSIIEGTRTSYVVMARDPDGQIVEFGQSSWRDTLPPKP